LNKGHKVSYFLHTPPAEKICPGTCIFFKTPLAAGVPGEKNLSWDAILMEPYADWPQVAP